MTTTPRRALELEGVRAEALVECAAIWIDLVRKHVASGGRLSSADQVRLSVLEGVLEEWQALGGRGVSYVTTKVNPKVEATPL